MSVEQYEIKDLKDFLAIPPEHLDELMTDIRDFYDFGRPLYELDSAFSIPVFIFKPDGKRSHTIKITHKEPFK